MMMLILPVIAMYSMYYLVCLPSRVLKNTYFKEHLSAVASKHRNLHHVQCLNIASMEKAWFIALMEKESWLQWNIIYPHNLKRQWKRHGFIANSNRHGKR